MNHNDEAGYDGYYARTQSELADASNIEEFRCRYEMSRIAPFHRGGYSKGYVRSLVIKTLVKNVARLGVQPSDVTVLDAGCGEGELSIYLAALGFKVRAVDISTVACEKVERLVRHFRVSDVEVIHASLDSLPLSDDAVNYVVGHASLHHFIKYDGVASELGRVLRGDGVMLFADSFGENVLYQLFHDREKMERLGDVILTRRKIVDFFHPLRVELLPTEWFAMLNKLVERVPRASHSRFVRRMTAPLFYADRAIPINRATLALSGAVLTVVYGPAAAEEGFGCGVAGVSVASR